METSEKKIKNIFLITVDCLRADILGCISGGKVTPELDKIAKKSSLYTNAFTNGPCTTQSFSAIFGSIPFLMNDGMHFSQKFDTIASFLSEKGYYTAGFHSNPFLASNFGHGKGFKEYYDNSKYINNPSATAMKSSFYMTLLKKILAYTRKRDVHSVSALKKIYYRIFGYQKPYVNGTDLNTQVIEWTQKSANTNTFMWIHYMDPHRPYIPPLEYSDKFASIRDEFIYDVEMNNKFVTNSVNDEEVEILKSLYESEVKYVDNCIGKLYSYLEDKKYLEESLLIITSDHGESFMEHNIMDHKYYNLHNEQLHIPLIISGMDENKKINERVQLIDLASTILDILNIENKYSFTGKSYFNKKYPLKERIIFSESARPNLLNLKYSYEKKIISCILDKWKFIYDEYSGQNELYNLDVDHGETNNVIETHPELAKTLGELVVNHIPGHLK